MKIIALELKKFFRLRNCIIALIVVALLMLLFNCFTKQNYAVSATHTKDYPDQFGIYDYEYSVKMLFEDFLLDTYGPVITNEHIDNLVVRRDSLVDQIAAAAATDEVLVRNNTLFAFDVNTGTSFYSDIVPGDYQASEDDKIYMWSCVNGQMRLDNTDHPIYFVNGFQRVIDMVATHGIYHVLGTDILERISYNLLPIVFFTLAALLLVIPYGVSEARSKTESLLFTTKTGRKVFSYKILSILLGSIIVIGIGIMFAAIMFSQWEIDRYFSSQIDSAFAIFNPAAFTNQVSSYSGMSLLTFYLIMCFVLAMAGTGLMLFVSGISFSVKNAVTAFAACIPVIVVMFVFAFRYLLQALDYNSILLINRWEHGIVAGIIFSLGIVLVTTISWKKRNTSY